VYAAVHPVIGKAAAVKILNPDLAKNQEMVQRFVDEARAVNQIRHRNIIDIFAFGTLPNGLHYFVMELLEGMSLDAYLEKHAPLEPGHALAILWPVGRALVAAHKAGVAHRDLKPENVFLTFDQDGGIFPKLLDFGIAKLLNESEMVHRTRTGVMMGTPLYMSPEQCRGSGVDHRSDIYSFGLGAVVAAAGAVAVAVIALGGGSSRPRPPVTPPVSGAPTSGTAAVPSQAPPIAPPAPAPVAPPAPPVAPATVTITVTGSPAGAVITGPDGLRGTVPGELVLPVAAQPIALLVEAPGHRAMTITVDPKVSTQLAVDLPAAPSPRPGKKPRPGRGSSSPLLEDPFKSKPK
jgi:serine/threonine protein kinase